MESHDLARVDWRMGQMLLPAHFAAQEAALTRDVASRFALGGLPAHGIGRLRWNADLLAEGVLSLSELSLVLPGGQLVDVPGNARVSTFNLGVVGATVVPVHLHLLERTVSWRETGLGEDDAQALDRVLLALELDAEPARPNCLASMRLAEFEKDPQDLWTLRAWFVPPLLQVGSNPFLLGALGELQSQLEQFSVKLSQRIADTFLSGESLASAKSCYRSVLRLLAFLADLTGEVHLHPYHLYRALRDFYVDVSFYVDSYPESSAMGRYRHDDLGRTLGRLHEAILERLAQVKARSPYIPFEKKNGLFVLESLPEVLRRAEEVYLLLQKPHVAKGLSTAGVKLSSLLRVATVHQLSLRGIPFEPTPRPPFQHPFGPEVEFLRLVPGEEWDYALRDGSLAFYIVPGFEDVTAFLYWRLG